ncbi:hypothetical protein ACHAXT_013093 [Thalassiosira profunda]
MSVSIVVQRFRECKLLLEETDYVTVGGGDESCGVLAYVSFSSSTTRSQVESAASTLVNLPVLTTGLWGDGASTTRSILVLAAEAQSKCSLVIVPQANLISKVKQGGKSIQYHGQINKEEGQELYEYFCDCLRGKLLELQCSESSEGTFRTAKQQQQADFSEHAPQYELFRDEEKYSAWDERGFPTKDAEGKDITKSQTKKLNKMYDAHVKRHEKWKEQNNGNDGSAQNVEEIAGPPAARWEECLDPSFCHFVAGSFGMRQGLELRSDMGPFVHSFRV